MEEEKKTGVIKIDPKRDRVVNLRKDKSESNKWKSYATKLKRNQVEHTQQTKNTKKAIRSIIDANTKSKLRQTIKRIPGVSALMEKRSPPYAKMSWPSLSSLSQKRKIKTTPGRRRLRKQKRKTVRYPNPNEKKSKNRRTPKTKGGSWIY